MILIIVSGQAILLAKVDKLEEKEEPAAPGPVAEDAAKSDTEEVAEPESAEGRFNCNVQAILLELCLSFYFYFLWQGSLMQKIHVQELWRRRTSRLSLRLVW